MKARLVSVLASMTLTAAALAVAAPAATAEPVAPGGASAAPVITGVALDYGYDSTVTGGFVYFTENVPSSTQLHLTVSACGRALHAQTFSGVVRTVTPDGSPGYAQFFDKTVTRSMAGPTIEVSVSFSDPALPPTSATAYTPNSYPRSCDALEPADDNGGGSDGGSVVVQRWSAKKGVKTAQVGKTLRVTATRAAGATVAYAWKVGAKVVDRDRGMAVKKSYVGKKVALRITVSKSGSKSVSKTLRFGTTR